jgi:FkbM family methyltransferase
VINVGEGLFFTSLNRINKIKKQLQLKHESHTIDYNDFCKLPKSSNGYTYLICNKQASLTIILNSTNMFLRRLLRNKFVMPIILRIAPKLFTKYESKYIANKDIEFGIIKHLCDHNKSSIDIGVLWGGYTVEMAKYSKEVYCYEPNINMCRHLERVFIGEPIIIKNVAVSDKEGIIDFRVPRYSPGNSTIETGNTLKGFKNILVKKVKMITIDGEGLKNVGFVKIDVEGHELNVLKGMLVLINSLRPNLLIEVEDRHRHNAINDVRDFLKSINYNMLFLKQNKLLDIEDFIADYQSDLKRGGKEYINNFIAVHSSKIDELKLKLKKAKVQIGKVIVP